MNCVKCGIEIPERRLKAIPGTKVCVNCSTTSPVKGIITVIGEGDHTATDIQIVSSEEYQKLENLKKKNIKSATIFEEDDNNITSKPQIDIIDESQTYN